MSESRAKRQPWAIGITAVIIIFLIVTISGTIYISQQKYSLVTENYYEKDRTYQQEIDTRTRTQAMDGKPEILFDREARSCTVTFPLRPRYDDLTGTITFFRISDAGDDKSIPLQLNSEGKQHISVSGFQSGQWILKFRWTDGGKEYFFEQRLYLQS
jgi:nitrogen fixation protein FixH